MRGMDSFFPATFLGYENARARVLDSYGRELIVDKWQVQSEIRKPQ